MDTTTPGAPVLATGRAVQRDLFQHSLDLRNSMSVPLSVVGVDDVFLGGRTRSVVDLFDVVREVLGEDLEKEVRR